ncbi:hypothetical protein [Alteromonas gilva]|uniref:Uncharacterized protein n=1 Tax=Alteromonas gilva TaxID=2987522 RepID=A0ABT5L7M1_9ALTE|nr:hypothetical protein [Alteromonas gilva]MDC8832877.1 hypothetical protein [Alteromonas gilva]
MAKYVPMNWVNKHFSNLTGYADIIFNSKGEELLCGLYAYLYCYSKQTHESENPLAYMTCTRNLAEYLLHPGTETYLGNHHAELYSLCKTLVARSAEMCAHLNTLYSDSSFDLVVISSDPLVTEVGEMVHQALSTAPESSKGRIQHIAYALIEASSPQARIRAMMDEIRRNN